MSKTESVCGEGGKVFGDENLNNRNKTLAKPRMRENYARLRRIYKQRTGMCLDLYQAIWGAKSGGHGLAVKWRTTDPQNGLLSQARALFSPCFLRFVMSVHLPSTSTLSTPPTIRKIAPTNTCVESVCNFFFKRTLLGTFFFVLLIGTAGCAR